MPEGSCLYDNGKKQIMPNTVYIDIFKDSFLSNFLITLSSEFAYPFALYFGKPDAVTASIAAFFGSVVGISASFALFLLLAKLLKKHLESNPNFPTVKHYITKFSPLMGALALIPELGLLPAFFFGIVSLSWRRFIAIICFYKAIYYTYMLISTQPILY